MPSNVNVMRQLPLTLTEKCPLSSRLGNECKPQPGTLMPLASGISLSGATWLPVAGMNSLDAGHTFRLE